MNHLSTIILCCFNFTVLPSGRPASSLVYRSAVSVETGIPLRIAVLRLI